jgi:NADP-dependent 3-hydroxy acid dehydrogenase YdfG
VAVEQELGGLDILIHSAGTYIRGDVSKASILDLDLQYQANFRAPLFLTQALLPLIRLRRGQIVFINSSAGLTIRPGVGQFSATQHALKVIADSLRSELNDFGVRVLTVFPGRTATPRQEIIHQAEGRPYHPQRLMQPEDVAAVVINALALNRTAEVTNIEIRPFLKFE